MSRKILGKWTFLQNNDGFSNPRGNFGLVHESYQFNPLLIRGMGYLDPHITPNANLIPNRLKRQAQNYKIEKKST